MTALFYQMLDDIAENYPDTSAIPKDTRLALAAEYINYCRENEDLGTATEFLEPFYHTTADNILKCLENVIYPHEKESRLLAIAELEQHLKRNALRIIDKMIESNINLKGNSKFINQKR